VASAKSFVSAVARGETTVAAAFGKLRADGVENFLIGYCRDHGPGSRCSALNSALALRHMISRADRSPANWCGLQDAVSGGCRVTNGL